MDAVDKLLDEAAKELQSKCEDGTMSGYYSYLGFLADFTLKVTNMALVNNED